MRLTRTAAIAIVGVAVASAGAASASTVPPTLPATEQPTVSSTPASSTPAAPEPPGELVDVDGHAMHLYCTGEGSPTVILDTGLGDSSVNFHPLQESIAEFTRVCSYDRAGYGWSEPGPEPRTSQQIVDELATLLDTAGESGPYVLAGHSFGGLNMILFAAEHPDDVAGVVLIDASHPEQTEALGEVPEVLAVQDAEIAGLGELAAAVEAGEVGAADFVAAAPADLPDDLKQTWAELFVQPHSLNTAVAEYAELATSMAQVAENGSLGDIPLIVLAHGAGLDTVLPPEAMEAYGLTPEIIERYEEIWRGLQEDHVTRSSDGTLVVAENSPHYIYRTEPEVVVTAIEDLVTAAQ